MLPSEIKDARREESEATIKEVYELREKSATIMRELSAFTLHDNNLGKLVEGKLRHHLDSWFTLVSESGIIEEQDYLGYALRQEPIVDTTE